MQEIPRPLAPPTWRERLADVQHGRSFGLIVLGAVALIAVVVAVAGTLLVTGGAASRGPDVALSLPRADTPESHDSPSTTAGELHVHAAGAVVQPGVVTVPAGARVTDVVSAAGGPAPDADLNQINLAAPVKDGERVYVPRQGETVLAASGSGAASTSTSDGLVNINDADAATLETLPGVGPATAQAIIDYRNEHGRFRSVDDLLNVRGIGPAKLSEIKPHARV